MATYLITGGAGFIGSHLSEEQIARGNRLRVFDNMSTGQRENLMPGVEFVHGDITDAVAVAHALEGVDGIFHLAGVSSVLAYTTDWAASGRVNAFGSFTVFEAAARAKLPIVYASSAAIYGNPAQLPLTEQAVPRPISGYGADKYGNELHAAAMADSLGLSAVGLRFFNVYGPRQLPNSAYSGVITVFLNRWRDGLPLTVFGDGSQTRDFIYVKDAARALSAAMDAATRNRATGGNAVYNVCSGRATSLLDLISALSRAVGASMDVTYAPARSGEIKASLGAPSAATRDLGFSSQTDLVTGLAQTIASQSISNNKGETPASIRQEIRQ